MLTSASFVHLSFFNSNDDLKDFHNYFSYHYNLRRLEIDSLNNQKNKNKKKSRRNHLGRNSKFFANQQSKKPNYE